MDDAVFKKADPQILQQFMDREASIVEYDATQIPPPPMRTAQSPAPVVPASEPVVPVESTDVKESDASTEAPTQISQDANAADIDKILNKIAATVGDLESDPDPIVVEAPTEEPIVTAEPVDDVVTEVDTAAPDIDDLTPVESSTRVDDKYGAIRKRLGDSVPVAQPMIKKGSVNRSLMYFLNDFRRKRQISDVIKIHGTLIRTTHSSGIWDEGGASANHGSVMFATDPNGEPLSPVKVDTDLNIVNGRHALVPVWVGCFVVLGGHVLGDDILAIYRVTEVQAQPSAGQRYPRLVCSLVAHCQGSVQWVTDAPSNVNWSTDHPAVKAAFTRMYEINANTPAYVQDYREYYFDANDYSSILADRTFVSTLQTFNTLREAYAAADEVLRARVPYVLTEQRVQLITSLNYYADTDMVVVFLLGLIYNCASRTSQAPDGERVFYGRTVLKPGDTFWYPDRDERSAVAYDDVKVELKKNGTMAATFRRMTP